jgi:LmbE family N-acetylglucosaminyl deacetylase
MIELPLRRDPSTPIEVLCLGAHGDDIEIGCGGTILRLTDAYPAASFRWVVFSGGDTERRAETLAGANLFLARAAAKHIVVEQFRESFFPYAGASIKEHFEQLKSGAVPDLVFTHYRFDLHQDHKLISDLTWNTFRSSLILEYEIPKWDGDLGTPNCYARLSEDIAERKIDSICATFRSQSAKHWFGADSFRALMRLRGIEANARYAEAFHARKLTLG